MLQRICSFVAVFDTAGVDLQRPVVATCETALTACGLAAAAHLLGKEVVPVYNVSVCIPTLPAFQPVSVTVCLPSSLSICLAVIVCACALYMVQIGVLLCPLYMCVLYIILCKCVSFILITV